MTTFSHTLAAGRQATEICFGLTRRLDEESLAIFLQRATGDALLRTLIPRLAEGEVAAVVDFLTGLMRGHLSEEEYHQLFLGD
ncbi:MAG: hypothetical protein OEV91_09080 [Desulfobulbaceae bacterium]|nr:hypothetical protein [Desulfobulbaceae bacterium]